MKEKYYNLSQQDHFAPHLRLIVGCSLFSQHTLFSNMTITSSCAFFGCLSSVDCWEWAKFILPAFLKRGQILFSQHSLREGQVYSPSIPQERSKFILPAFLETGPSLFSRLPQERAKCTLPASTREKFSSEKEFVEAMGLISPTFFSTSPFPM